MPLHSDGTAVIQVSPGQASFLHRGCSGLGPSSEGTPAGIKGRGWQGNRRRWMFYTAKPLKSWNETGGWGQ